MATTAKRFWQEAQETMEYLFARWGEESQFEDINDYAIPLKEIADKIGGVNILKMTKRPFGCRFTADGKIYIMTINNRNYQYQRVG